MTDAPDAVLGRLARTPALLEEAIRGRALTELGRRPTPRDWSPTEILCHLRDVEELFQVRFHTILGADEPRILVPGATPEQLAPWGIGGNVRHPLDPDRWAEERQYSRSDPMDALAAFRYKRKQVLALLRPLSPGQWERGGIHLGRGRLTLCEWAGSLARHDDNHLDQLRRAVDGGPVEHPIIPATSRARSRAL